MKNPFCYLFGHDMAFKCNEEGEAGVVPVEECQRLLCDHREKNFRAKVALDMLTITGVAVVEALTEAQEDEEERGEGE